MGHPDTLRACAIAGALVFTSAAGVLAQGSFQIDGRVKVEGGGLDGTRVLVYKNGEKQRTLNSGLSKFSLDLDLNANYILAFEKDGFVTKKLSFDTHAPAEAITNGFTPFEFAVNMFKQYDDVNMVVFNQPVGMIRYDNNADDFDYDTDYTKSIQSALEKTLQEVAQKQEQEKNKDADEAKRKLEEEKAKARAEAEKVKQDAEAVRQKSKQEKEAAEAAKREQELKDAEAKKAEAAARKAEQERLAAASKKKEPEIRPKPEPPAPVAKVKPPKPQPEPVPVKRAGSRIDPKSGEEGRRTATVNESAEGSPLRPAKTNEVEEARPELQEEPVEVSRNEELIVEPNQVITRIELDDGRARTEYRKVVHKYGSVFYFKDGQSISQLVFETEALAENE